MNSGNNKIKPNMPQISDFFSIIIRMFYDEHKRESRKRQERKHKAVLNFYLFLF